MLVTFDVPFEPEATELAVDAAVESGQRLLVVNVAEVPLRPISLAMGYEYIDTEEVEDALRAPTALALSLAVEVERLRLCSPRPIDALLELVAERAPGLLVFGPDRERLTRRTYASRRSGSASARPARLAAAERTVVAYRRARPRRARPRALPRARAEERAQQPHPAASNATTVPVRRGSPPSSPRLPRTGAAIARDPSSRSPSRPRSHAGEPARFRDERRPGRDRARGERASGSAGSSTSPNASITFPVAVAWAMLGRPSCATLWTDRGALDEVDRDRVVLPRDRERRRLAGLARRAPADGVARARAGRAARARHCRARRAAARAGSGRLGDVLDVAGRRPASRAGARPCSR